MPVRSTAIALGPQSSTPAAVSAYREFEPPSTLAETIACTWEGQEGWSRALRVLPDGCVDLTWDGRAVRVAGAIPSPVRHLIDAHADNVGIRLKPGWAPRVIGVPACHLPPVLELVEIWAAATFGRLEEHLAAAVTSSARRGVLVDLVDHRLADGEQPDGQVLAAAEHLARTDVSVQSTADAVGLSVRQLRRRFDEHVGLSPKTLQTILRFQRFLRRAEERPNVRRDLAQAAVDRGYTDQSHLARECRRLAGSTPSSLLAS